MADGVVIEHNDAGRLTARKCATGPTAVERLRQETSVVRRIAGPGVVRLVREQDTDGAATGDRPAEIELAYAGRDLLASPPTSLEAALSVVRGAAAVLCRAHAAGVSHGRIDRSHVLLDESGAVTICGWADAGVAGSQASRFDPDGDVAQVGVLLAGLMEELPPPKSRSLKPGGQRRQTHVAALAAALRQPNPQSRPSLTELSAHLDELLPEGSGHHVGAATAPAPSASLDRVRAWGQQWARHGPQAAIVGAIATLAAVVTVMGIQPFDDGATSASPSRVGAASVEVVPTTTEPPGEEALAPTPSTAPSTTTSCPARASELQDATLPASCIAQLHVNGQTISLGADRFELGQAGDVVAVADLFCKGTASAIILRPATGELWVFPRWAAPSTGTSAALAGTYPGATAISTPGAGCGELALTDADGSTTTVTTRELQL